MACGALWRSAWWSSTGSSGAALRLIQRRCNRRRMGTRAGCDDKRERSGASTRVSEKGYQAVEKVVVEPVGGGKCAETRSKTLRKRAVKPPNGAHRRARGSFSTRWDIPGSFLEITFSEARLGKI